MFYAYRQSQHFLAQLYTHFIFVFNIHTHRYTTDETAHSPEMPNSLQQSLSWWGSQSLSSYSFNFVEFPCPSTWYGPQNVCGLVHITTWYGPQNVYGPVHINSLVHAATSAVHNSGGYMHKGVTFFLYLIHTTREDWHFFFYLSLHFSCCEQSLVHSSPF